MILVGRVQYELVILCQFLLFLLRYRRLSIVFQCLYGLLSRVSAYRIIIGAKPSKVTAFTAITGLDIRELFFMVTPRFLVVDIIALNEMFK